MRPGDSRIVESPERGQRPLHQRHDGPDPRRGGSSLATPSRRRFVRRSALIGRHQGRARAGHDDGQGQHPGGEQERVAHADVVTEETDQRRPGEEGACSRSRRPCSPGPRQLPGRRQQRSSRRGTRARRRAPQSTAPANRERGRAGDHDQHEPDEREAGVSARHRHAAVAVEQGRAEPPPGRHRRDEHREARACRPPPGVRSRRSARR